MATYSEHEQRQLDASSGAEMDKRASTEVARAGFAQSTEIAARSAQSEAGQMLSQIMAVILDPSVPETRLDRLLALQEKLVADQRRMMFVEAMARLTPLLPTIDRTGKIIVFSKRDREAAAANDGRMPAGAQPIQQTGYAKQEDIIEAIRPMIGEFGFALSFVPGRTEQGRITMKARLSHVGGHVEEIDIPNVEVDSSGSKNNIQGLGSSLKYLQRYGTLLLLPIVSRDPRDGLDNDGANGARIEGDAGISDEQYAVLQAEITRQGGRTLASVLTAFGLEDKSLADLPAAKFEECKQRLRERAAAAQKGGTR